mmetsp:Transcript_11182/g.34126  ORF Transcript_11182/g.34126 Transcript_11182/m.34126 type:complete len:207 (+) Transcript_11182:2002-2622(+)
MLPRHHVHHRVRVHGSALLRGLLRLCQEDLRRHQGRLRRRERGTRPKSIFSFLTMTLWDWDDYTNKKHCLVNKSPPSRLLLQGLALLLSPAWCHHSGCWLPPFPLHLYLGIQSAKNNDQAEPLAGLHWVPVQDVADEDRKELPSGHDGRKNERAISLDGVGDHELARHCGAADQQHVPKAGWMVRNEAQGGSQGPCGHQRQQGECR